MNGLKRLGLMFLTVLTMAALGIALDFFVNSGIGPAGSTVEARPAAEVRGSVLPAGPLASSATAPLKLPLAEIEDTRHLVLIGPDQAAVDQVPQLTGTADGRHHYRSDIQAAVAALLQAAEDSGHPVTITSAYRSRAEQADLHAEIEDPTLVQPPGHSEHETGLALDLQPVAGADGLSGPAFEKTVAYLEEHSARFGFIQRYPRGRQEITGIQYEYWHYRFVGSPHAAFMADKGLTLEEYLDLLAYSGQLDIQDGATRYRVYWKEPVAGEIQFYPGAAYAISSTNTGAYIVTVTSGGQE